MQRRQIEAATQSGWVDDQNPNWNSSPDWPLPDWLTWPVVPSPNWNRPKAFWFWTDRGSPYDHRHSVRRCQITETTLGQAGSVAVTQLLEHGRITIQPEKQGVKAIGDSDVFFNVGARIPMES